MLNGGNGDRSSGIEVGGTRVEVGSWGGEPCDRRGNLLESALICVRVLVSLTGNKGGGEIETPQDIDPRNRSGSGEGAVG